MTEQQTESQALEQREIYQVIGRVNRVTGNEATSLGGLTPARSDGANEQPQTVSQGGGAVVNNPQPIDECRFAGFCEREAWECALCNSWTPKSKRTQFEAAVAAAQQPTTPKQAFLESLDLGHLRDHAHGILNEITLQRNSIADLKRHLAASTEEMESQRCRLMMTGAYAAGKNEAIRNAWLAQQRQEDPDYSMAIADLSRVQRELEAAGARLDALEKEFCLDAAEMRLASAELMFMAGD